MAIAPEHVARRLRRAVGLPEAEGLLIRDVSDDSPASRAGLARGDLLVEAGGRALRGPDDLLGALDGLTAPTLALRVVRGAEEREVVVALP